MKLFLQILAVKNLSDQISSGRGLFEMFAVFRWTLKLTNEGKRLLECYNCTATWVAIFVLLVHMSNNNKLKSFIMAFGYAESALIISDVSYSLFGGQDGD